MKVKRLEISGFKSFAQRAVLDFPDGLCAVVGPNGCGKSNVVDAIRWVLGEQSARQLRGQAMEDVIFNGAQSHKPTGLAEVSIVFENAGTISAPQYADLAEIMVTRRLYRNGESDYQINRRPCRLKDIQQLLMDTGLGNRAYAIIEQGKVASFIDSRPEERRLWVEEAAGITRYKNQKKQSLKKMEGARENLDRLQDIIIEVDSQMARLQRQAKKAMRHKELRDKIRELDLALGSFEFAALGQAHGEVSAELAAATAQLELTQRNLSIQETDLERARLAMLEAEQLIDQAGAKRLETQGAIQRAENELTLLGREAENMRRLAQRLGGERDELVGRLKTMGEDMAKAAARAERCRAEAQSGQRLAEEAAEQVALAQESLRVRQRRADEAKHRLVDHLSRRGQINNRLGDLERRQAEIRRRQEQLAIRRGELEDELAQAEDDLAQAVQRIEELTADLAAAQARADALQQRQKSQQDGLRALRRDEDDQAKAHQALSAGVEALELSLGSLNWAAESVRQVVAAAQAGQLPVALLGLVVQRVEAKPGHEELLALALGPWLQALIVQGAAEAEALTHWAAREGLGALRVVAMDRLATRGVAAPAEATRAVELATFAPGLEALAHLLEGVGCCADQAAAWAAAPGLLPGQAVVAAGGLRLDGPALLTLAGDQGQSGGSVLGQRNELTKRRQQLEQSRLLLDDLSAQRQALQADMARVEAQATEVASQLQAGQRELQRARQHSSALQEAAGQRRRRLEGLEFDHGEALEELAQLRQEQEDLAAEAEELEQIGQRLEDELSQAQEALDEAREALEDARTRESEVKLRAASRQSEADHAAQEAKRLERETVAAGQRRQSLDDEIAGADESVRSLLARRQGEQTRLGGLYEQLDSLEAAYNQARQGHGEIQARAMALEAEIKAARAGQKSIEAEIQAHEFKRRELEMRRDQLREQVLERCRVDLAQDLATHLPAGPFDPQANRQRLDKLRVLLGRLGPVNMEAIVEHEALQERHRFLTEQKADLDASLDDLRQAIRKINRTSRDRFMDTLEEVNQRLGTVFPVLFGGGSARLVLDEGVDPLEAGLHLLVEPPGKKVKNLEALSGGEKALAAVAVLFALFLIRPAPFCILDEVDAPLDEANTGRFLDLVRQLGQHSQIITITHNRRTMEIMDVLYGVTMEERGISKLLSVSLMEGASMAA
ncbi:chromosome segregation protein SMC [Desulfarculus baarsii]